jgi:hypothetical protein
MMLVSSRCSYRPVPGQSKTLFVLTETANRAVATSRVVGLQHSPLRHGGLNHHQFRDVLRGKQTDQPFHAI